MKSLTRTLDLTNEAADFLEKLRQPKQYKQVAQRVLGLMQDPEPHDSSPLKGRKYEAAGLRRVDVGEYRIVYRFADTRVEVILIGHRNDDAVYRDLKHKTVR